MAGGPDAQRLRRSRRRRRRPQSVARVGAANHNATMPSSQPSVTRHRASHAARRSATRARRQPPLHRRARLPPPGLAEAPRRLDGSGDRSGSAQSVVARDRHVARRPRTVPLRIGRSEKPDARRAHRGRDVQRAGVAGDDQRRGARERDQIPQAGRRRQRRQRRREPRRPLPPALPRPGPRARSGVRPDASLQERRDLAETFGRPSLVRPGGARIDQREAARPPIPIAHAVQRRRRRRRPAETRSLDRSTPIARSRRRFLRMTCAAFRSASCASE